MTQTIEARRAAFRALHAQGCFIIPNPWDIGSAQLLQHMGFKALASTSSGHAWSVGQQDGQVPLAQVLEHLRQLVQAVDLPINADFVAGYAAKPEGVEAHVGQAVATGIAGVSLEDATGDPAHPLRALPDAIERMQAARQAIDHSGADVLLVGRAENFLVGQPDLNDTVRRLQAYAEAGADCLYAPGIQSARQIRTVVQAVAPKPVNVLIGNNQAVTLDDMAALGVRRISVGGALARCAWGALHKAATALAQGRFDAFDGALPYPQVNELFARARSGSA
ncbi:oxaloacetate decarboxylase [Castellaniella sp.]|uniref:isocitrate lyase/PEP mutase family protein n=1 Tax=Castellaniella sp. TaxID=1955812 RepID=UPI00356A015A